MDYEQFKKVIVKGEYALVDFKIICEAFKSKKIAPKAELAKDICAMSNNGKVSYIIIGVSDDRKDFATVTNEKLTDDALQDFCKKAISPPPKVSLQKVNWSEHVAVLPEHEKKEFVIIKVGPHQKQVFSLGQDFINYGEEICYRKNEVWIRRGATSDLAIPKEIISLSRGKLVIENAIDDDLRISREEFAKLPQESKLSSVNLQAKNVLESKGYNEIIDKNDIVKLDFPYEHSSDPFGEHYKYGSTFWKLVDQYLIFSCILPCTPSIYKRYLRRIDLFDSFEIAFENLPKYATQNIPKGEKIMCLKLWVIPILSRVLKSSIEGVLDRWSWNGPNLRYYRSVKSQFSKSDKHRISSKSEVLFVTNIHSIEDFKENLNNGLDSIERIGQG